MSKPFTPLQSKAVTLIANGHTESEVMSVCGKSRSWVQNLKRRKDFQIAVENAQKSKESFKKELQQDLQQCQKQVFQEVIRQDLTNWAVRQQQLREQEWELCQKLIAKVEQMLEYDLADKKWGFRDCANLLVVASKIGRTSSELWQDDLNAAVGLVIRYGYGIIDTRKLEVEIETETETEDDD